MARWWAFWSGRGRARTARSPEATAGPAPPEPARGLEADQPIDSPRGLLLVAGGVGGLDYTVAGLRFALRAERLNLELQAFPWGHGWGHWFADLTDVGNRDAQAAQAARAVEAFRAERPDAPVFLIGKSGGAGIIVKALERLGPEMVDRAVLLAPALAPHYDLSGALNAVRRDLVVFYSPLDFLILGAGTYLFGTADRARSWGAGMVGFRAPPAGSDEACLHAYEKLRQVCWGPRMAAFAHLGGHAGPDNPFFLRKYIVPLLRSDATGTTFPARVS